MLIKDQMTSNNLHQFIDYYYLASLIKKNTSLKSVLFLIYSQTFTNLKPTNTLFLNSDICCHTTNNLMQCYYIMKHSFHQ